MRPRTRRGSTSGCPGQGRDVPGRAAPMTWKLMEPLRELGKNGGSCPTPSPRKRRADLMTDGYEVDDLRHKGRSSLAEQLRFLRARSGLTLSGLAERTSYSRSSWERYLNGKAVPPRAALTEFAAAVGVAAPPLHRLREEERHSWRAGPRAGRRSASRRRARGRARRRGRARGRALRTRSPRARGDRRGRRSPRGARRAAVPMPGKRPRCGTRRGTRVVRSG
ncbi:helix-turn-helix transcriptional regulator [Streptomyces sp. NRRL F-5065]|uniref:helix-turn-helix domain-containing protein n=1 Tax=Streptomyces sp. NRRL F-5065 TaxID=1463855 RepID=UPI002D21AC23|nr:helix-turn-helix transcriptional regulator [Streptomyces sp. NRRL F-5065]